MLHELSLYLNKKGFSEFLSVYGRRGDTGELISATFTEDENTASGTLTYDADEVYFEASGEGVAVRRKVDSMYVDLSNPKSPRIKGYPMP